MKSSFNEKKFLEVVGEIAQECRCKNEGYCFFRCLIETMHLDMRMLIQFKCIEKFKWIWSKEKGDDLGWHNAGMKWVEDGFAKDFADVYSEEESVASIYKKMLALRDSKNEKTVAADNADKK